jgi:type II secretory pathway component PulL
MRQAISELNAIDPGYEKYSADNDADANEKERDTLSSIKAIQDANNAGEAKKYALDHRRYRLEWKAYRAARLTLLFLIVYTGLTLIVAYQSIRSADATKKSADTAASQLELTQRPWVYVKDAEVASPLVFDKDGRT